MKKNNAKQTMVVIHNQQTKAIEERPLEEVKEEVKKTKEIPMGIFTLGALVQIAIATTGQ